MNISKIITLLSFLICVTAAYSQSEGRYRVSFTDKENSPYSISHPHAFLSERAIARRNNQNIPIQENDIPVNQWYIDSVLQYDARLCNVSKWFNSIIIELDTCIHIPHILALPFVVECVKVGDKTGPAPEASNLTDTIPITDFSLEHLTIENSANVYGASYTQIAISNGMGLHLDGFTGADKIIAILDAGFLQTDSIQAFAHAWNNNQILAYKDFSGSGLDIFRESHHGTAVFSLIGGYAPGYLIGAAPRAQYLLLRTEEAKTEFPVEEENWIAAAEFADSLGADIINTSLGYSTFDREEFNYTYENMDGKTTRISQGARIAASKGMLLVTSAGNSGNKEWKYITAPADADSIITVGAIHPDSTITRFSSIGPSFDMRVKPEVVTLGFAPSIVTRSGLIEKAGMGTSFSSPLIAGLAACLWQEFPNATAQQIRKAIIESTHRYYSSSAEYGFGIPDFEKARRLLRLQNVREIVLYARVFPNPFSHSLTIEVVYPKYDTVQIELYSLQGRKIFEQTFPVQSYISQYTIQEFSDVPPGLYIAVVKVGPINHIQKITKLE